MSDVIKDTFVNYMFCAVAGGMLEYIAPEKAKKLIRIILVAVILSITLAPVLKIDVDFSMPDEQYAEDDEYENLLHMRNLVEKKIRAEMREIIINAGIDEYEIYVTTEGDEETLTVYLQRVEIQLGEEYSHLVEQIRDSAPEEYRSIVEVGVKR